MTFVYSKTQVKNLNEFKNFNLDATFNTKVFDKFYLSCFNKSLKKSNSTDSDTSLTIGSEIIDSLVHEFNMPEKYEKTFNDIYNITLTGANIEEELKTYIGTVTNDDTLKNYTITIATVANSSTQFWTNYFNQGGRLPKTGKVLLPPVVAADLVWGAAGEIGTIINEWGNINWWHVGGFTLVGAVAGSIGIKIKP